ncbi:hypothetical protein pipiens_016381 [Culex pipiens pipiens]|uniref:Uncharacterized protein n=1 Tax=Culex pipiens pipiens TaxID=38569 RepID=A0ABD1CLN4_CULPP
MASGHVCKKLIPPFRQLPSAVPTGHVPLEQSLASETVPLKEVSCGIGTNRVFTDGCLGVQGEFEGSAFGATISMNLNPSTKMKLLQEFQHLALFKSTVANRNANSSVMATNNNSNR